MDSRTTANYTTVTAGNFSYQLALPDSEYVGECIKATGHPYEYDLLRSTRRLVSDGDVVLDVGAHLGNHSLYWAVVRHANVTSFEPNDALADLIEASALMNHVDSKVLVSRKGVGARLGRGELRIVDDFNLGMTQLKPSLDGHTPITSLDSSVEGPVRLIKIDTEGMEMDVLSGAAGILANGPVLIIEAHGAQTAAVSRHLRKFGYRRIPISLADSPTWVYLTNLTDLGSLARTPWFWATIVKRAAIKTRSLILALQNRRSCAR